MTRRIALSAALILALIIVAVFVWLRGSGSTEPVAHGLSTAEAACPGTAWQTVEAEVFRYSVPADFTEDEPPEFFDSETATWSNDSMFVDYDYGSFSNELHKQPGPLEVADVNYSGYQGKQVVLTVAGAASEDRARGFAGLHFPEVEREGGQWNKLNLVAFFENDADEALARCIVSSIEWK